MAISMSASTLLPIFLVVLVLYATPAAAFGAGNIAAISSIEGSNWRHGDIEDTLLQLFMAAAANNGKRKKFDAMAIKRIYFGNWLRDYSQAIDVGALKNVEAGTVRILLWVLSFMTFGLATGEFEVTEERLGCYRPEEHIDNPKDYADNEDATRYYNGLRKPVDEEIELAIDPETGLKNYIANENLTINTGEHMDSSAELVRKLFTQSIELGRRYGQNGDKKDKYEAWRLLGTGLHCLEDYSAHSNYTELALIELGENDVFPHVGRDTQVNIAGRDVWPLITGTFGGVDFMHSVLGEVSDKAIQSEVQQLEESIEQASREAEQNGEGSILKDLLKKLNIGGGDDLGSKAEELENKSTEQKNSSEPWGLGTSADDMARELYPILEFHDNIMKSINAGLAAVGVASLMENLTEAASLFVFSLMAPYILPLLKQVKSELEVGSSAVIGSSKNAQHIVFDDDSSSDPTHSMLSKDHFTNVLNEPAGKIASAILKFAVPKIMDAWDDENIDCNQVCDEIIGGVFHHPSFRDGSDGRPGTECREQMFAVVENWWNEKSNSEKNSLRQSLSREGVQNGKNHKGSDTGHGCGKPLQRKAKKLEGSNPNQELGSQAGAAIEKAIGGAGGGSSGFGSMLGGLAGVALGKAFGNDKEEGQEEEHNSRSSNTREYAQGREAPQQQSRGYGNDGEETSSYGRRNQEQETSSYGQRQQQSSYGRQDETPSYGQQQERSAYGRQDETPSYGQQEERSSYGQSSYGQREEQPSYGRQQESSYGGQERSSHGRGEQASYYGSEEQPSYGRQEERSSGYGGEERSSYGQQEERSSYGQQEHSSYGQQERSSYGQREERSEYNQESSYGESRGGYGDDERRRRGGDDGKTTSHYGREDHGGKSKKKKSGSDDDTEKRSADTRFGGGYDSAEEKRRKKAEKEKKKYGKEDSGDEKKKSKKYGKEDSGDEKKSKKYGKEDSGDEKKKSKKYGKEDSGDEKKKSKKYGKEDSGDEKKYKKYGKEDSGDEKKYKKYGKKDDSGDEDKHRRRRYS